MAHKYQAEIRPNDRGGFEIGDPGTPAGTGLGNYATAADAMAVACYSFDRADVRAWREPASKQPAHPPAKARRAGAVPPKLNPMKS